MNRRGRKPYRARCVGAILAVAVAASVAASAVAASPGSTEARALPDPEPPGAAFEGVWFRTEERAGLRFRRATGMLQVLDDRVVFEHRRHGFDLPYTDIERLSFGPMRASSPNEWVILRTSSGEPSTLVAFRDGARFGYGASTAQIHGAVRNALRRARAAQFDLPSGYRAFEVLAHQVAFGVPTSAEIVAVDRVVVEGFDRTGTVEIRVGDGVPPLRLSRVDAVPRDACRAGATASARRSVAGAFTVSADLVDRGACAVDGCEGWAFGYAARDEEAGVGCAVTHEDVAYAFVVPAAAGGAALLERWLSTASFSDARRPIERTERGGANAP